MVPDYQKADLLDGVIYLAPPEATESNQILLWLCSVIGLFVEERQLGEITINGVAYRFSVYTAPEPDLAFIAANRRNIIKSNYVDGPPDLAIEIVSPDSIDRDYEIKRRRYEEAGVQEYWIIDPLENTATFLVREGDAFVEQFPPDHFYESRVLPGFKLDTRWLFQRPLPATMPIIRRLLGHN